MRLELDQEQDSLVRSLQTLFTRMAGPDQARKMAGDLDRPLLEALAHAGFLDIAAADGDGLLDALLVVEQAEAAHAQAPVAARAIVAPLVLDAPPLAVGLVDADASALVRYAGLCDCYLVLDGDRALCVDALAADTATFPTRWGYPIGSVDVGRAKSLSPGSGERLRAGWQVALAAEMGAAMQEAVQLTARYVSERRQFGRPIASFQAVSHRLARAAVVAEGSTWLARRAAADIGDVVMAAAAATYAAESAQLVAESTHQVTGAIGITVEYDLVLSTMRLGVLQTELGGAARHALGLADWRWPGAG